MRCRRSAFSPHRRSGSWPAQGIGERSPLAAAILKGTVTGVVLERRMKIRVEEKMQRHSRTEFVWPSDKLGGLLTNLEDRLTIDGEPENTWLSFWEAGLQADTCVSISRQITLSVFDERKGLLKVTADLG